jgi:hypothetical protein
MGTPGRGRRLPQVEWQGERWALDRDGSRYNGSPRTARVEYVRGVRDRPVLAVDRQDVQF